MKHNITMKKNSVTLDKLRTALTTALFSEPVLDITMSMVSAIGQVLDADEEATDQSRSMETKCVNACYVLHIILVRTS